MLSLMEGSTRSLLKRLVTFSLLSFFALVACNAVHSPRNGSTTRLRERPQEFCLTRVIDPISALSQNEKKLWLAKAYRLLRGGKGLRSTDDIEALQLKTRGVLIQSLIDDAQFGDFVLDFNLYFLGFKRDRLRDDLGMLTQGPFDFSQALNSAIQTLQCGDYETLLQLDQKLFAAPLKSPILPEGAPEEWRSLPPQDLRKKIFTEIQSPIDQLISDIKVDPSRNQAQTCQSFFDSLGQAFLYYFSLGAPFELLTLGPLEGGIPLY
ncbi:MAG: IS1 family transposase [Bdellovibrionales bacterium]|nr:IS1 family transposase [Bdellovibrionales bacterium]